MSIYLVSNCTKVLQLISNFADKLGSVARSVQDGFVTLAVKFLHFFISKCLQFRYLPPLHLGPSTLMSLLFWVAFTRSISSMPDNPL